MNRVLAMAAVLEMAMGLALMIDPALVARLLLGEGASGAGVVVGRIAGLGFLSLGLACWPVGDTSIRSSSFRAMFLYNVLVAGYLGILGARGRWVGWLLWPAVMIHTGMSIVLALVWIRDLRYSSQFLRPDTKHDSK